MKTVTIIVSIVSTLIGIVLYFIPIPATETKVIIFLIAIIIALVIVLVQFNNKNKQLDKELSKTNEQLSDRIERHTAISKLFDTQSRNLELYQYAHDSLMSLITIAATSSGNERIRQLYECSLAVSSRLIYRRNSE